MPRSTYRTAAALAVLVAAPLGAQIVPGSTLVFTGVADASDVGTPGVLLAFDQHVTIEDASTGSFAVRNGGVGGSQATIGDVVVGHGPQRVPNFLHFGAYRFDLEFLPSGTYGQDECYVEPVVGQRCTPFQSVLGDPYDNVGASPFFVTNGASGDPAAPFTSVAAFNVVGTVRGPGAVSSAFYGTIASTFVGRSYQEVLYTLETEGLSAVTFTGTLVAGTPAGTPSGGIGVADTVVPEPGTWALVGAGLAGVFGLARRRRV